VLGTEIDLIFPTSTEPLALRLVTISPLDLNCLPLPLEKSATKLYASAHATAAIYLTKIIVFPNLRRAFRSSSIGATAFVCAKEP
jgi:hypothetical protein